MALMTNSLASFMKRVFIGLPAYAIGIGATALLTHWLAPSLIAPGIGGWMLAKLLFMNYIQFLAIPMLVGIFAMAVMEESYPNKTKTTKFVGFLFQLAALAAICFGPLHVLPVALPWPMFLLAAATMFLPTIVSNVTQRRRRAPQATIRVRPILDALLKASPYATFFALLALPLMGTIFTGSFLATTAALTGFSLLAIAAAALATLTVAFIIIAAIVCTRGSMARGQIDLVDEMNNNDFGGLAFPRNNPPSPAPSAASELPGAPPPATPSRQVDSELPKPAPISAAAAAAAAAAPPQTQP